MCRLLSPAAICLGLLCCPSSHAQPPDSQHKNQSKLVTVTYPVADLVIPIAFDVSERATSAVVGMKPSLPKSEKSQPAPAKSKENRAGSTQEQALVDLIYRMVAPESWKKSGGRGSLDYHALAMGLVVRQTEQVHEELRALLVSLRHLQDVEISLEICMAYLPDSAEGKLPGAIELPGKNKIAYLDDSQYKILLETIQKEKRGELLQSPKLTVFNGQRAGISICDVQFFLTKVNIINDNNQQMYAPNNQPYEIGFRASFCPTVSADRKSVFLDLAVKRTTLIEPVPVMPVQIPVPNVLEGPGNGNFTVGQPTFFQVFLQQPKFSTQSVEQKFSIPTGKTALILAGKEQRPIKTEFASGVFGQVPYINRLFTTTTRESRNTILLVTPRVIINQEPETIYLGEKLGSSLRPQGN